MVQINLRHITRDFHVEIKMAALRCGLTQEKFIEAAIKEKIARVYGEEKDCDKR